MKIDKVIMSTNDSPTYIEFWPYISQAWKKLLGNNVEVVLGYVTDKSQEESSWLNMYGKVIHFHKRHDIPDSNHAKVVRTLIASRYSNEYCLLSDIDMLPLNADYFIKNSKYVNDNNIVIYSSDQSGIPAKYPICYLLAKGKVFKEIINPDNHDEDQLLTSWFDMKLYGEDEAINNTRFSDESLYRIFFERWGVLDKNKHRTVFLKRKWSKNIARHRIDRAKWHIDMKKLRKGKYIDSHLVRPLHEHEENIKLLFDYLGINEK